ncbi:MAG: hypothetical protein ABFE07_06970 [Armatimonadia bacterium]
MILYEHAKKLYDAVAPPGNNVFWHLDFVGKMKWFIKAYDELAAERDRLQALEAAHSDTPADPYPSLTMREIALRLQGVLGRFAIRYGTDIQGDACLVVKQPDAAHLLWLLTERYPQAKPTDPGRDRDKPASDPSIDWPTVLQLAAALKYPDNKALSVNGVLRDALAALSPKHDFMLKPGGTLSAEALRELNSWGLSPDAFKVATQPDPATYEWESWTLRRNGQEVGFITCHSTPTNISSWRYNATQSAFSGQAKTIGLAKAAVEAVVRAHFGDDA